MDDVVPHSQDEDSSAYHAQRERLERNEFFKECLAPLRCVLKVGNELQPLCTAGVMPYPGRSPCAPTTSHASAGSSGSPVIEMRRPSVILRCGSAGGTDTMRRCASTALSC